MAKKQRKQDAKWSMYQSKDAEVAQLLEENNLSFKFHHTDSDDGANRTYDTNIMGKFMCPNDSCPTKCWSSKKIAVTIRMYDGCRYNARVYHQHCKRCGRISRPTLDFSYAERVAYRLKKWSGMYMQPPPFSEKAGKPHERSLCEGCKAGHCSNGDDLADKFDDLTLKGLTVRFVKSREGLPSTAGSNFVGDY